MSTTFHSNADWVTVREAAEWATTALGRPVSTKEIYNWADPRTTVTKLQKYQVGRRTIIKTSDLLSCLKGVLAREISAASPG